MYYIDIFNIYRFENVEIYTNGKNPHRSMAGLKRNG